VNEWDRLAALQAENDRLAALPDPHGINWRLQQSVAFDPGLTMGADPRVPAKACREAGFVEQWHECGGAWKPATEADIPRQPGVLGDL
jgi:hypothetical protein